LKNENPDHVVVSAGDLVGATPLISASYHDEATIEAMNLLGLDFSAVGNHEFDRGPAELPRKQNGGCFPGGAGCLPVVRVVVLIALGQFLLRIAQRIHGLLDMPAKFDPFVEGLRLFEVMNRVHHVVRRVPQIGMMEIIRQGDSRYER
jgi:hypothetical protein